MDLGIKGKVALVAGASTGIGYGAAWALASEGARVVISSRSEERIAAAADRLRSETGAEVASVAVDVTHPDAGRRFVDAARESFGPPSILVTNGGGPAGGAFSTLTPEDFTGAVDLGFLSVVRLTHAALPAMLEAGWGRLVHISSATVVEPNPDLFLSSSVRPAVAGFSKALSNEVAAQGVTSNLVLPGYVETEALTHLAERRGRESGQGTKAALAAMGATVPMGRLATPRELGQAVAFLCSEPAGYITGVALRVDGGKVAYAY